jgi:DNA-binding HxlR family transcriptional regulator
VEVGVQVDKFAESVESDAFNGDCPGRAVFDHVTSRWGVLIIAALRTGPLRFSQMHAKIGGMSEKMLSQTLRTLVRDGLIDRAVEPSTPPKVSYSLTSLGAGLSSPLQQLLDWVSQHTNDVTDAQRRHDLSAP